MASESKSAGLRRERTIASPRFRDGRFHNTDPVDSTMKKGSMLATTSEYFFGNAVRRPPGALPIESPLETWRLPAETGLRATWLGHSTTLLEIDGHRVLTDPVWSERISPIPVLGPRRFHAVPVTSASSRHSTRCSSRTTTSITSTRRRFVSSLVSRCRS